jgi:translation elongation factor EF-Ts
MSATFNELVKKLREETGVGIMECKKALQQGQRRS